MIMRLVGWKRPDIVVEACSRLGVQLVVAGDGRDQTRLKRIAGTSVHFVGRVDDDRMRDLYRGCRALILPSEEDFGITPLEAMASGRPVIAFGRGGALDTLLDGVTGTFFYEQTAEAVMSTISAFDDSKFDPTEIRNHAEQFDSAIFRAKMQRHATGVMTAFKEKYY
jgi:glycosyltransferase involved in cell wall biosynthesis